MYWWNCNDFITLYRDKEATKDIDFILDYEDYKLFDEIEPEVSKKHEAPIDYFVGGWIVGYKLPEDFREESRKVYLDLKNIEIYLISLPDLAITKILAGRPNDVDDLGKIFRNHPEIRRDALEERFGLLKIHKTGEGLGYEGKFTSFLNEFFPTS